MTYDYEYVGNGARLVITPLTDRIYMMATQNLKMGCTPAGPARTRKTENAKLIYVVNCSPEMDYKSLGNILKAAALIGEFNGLVPKVLSALCVLCSPCNSSLSAMA